MQTKKSPDYESPIAIIFIALLILILVGTVFVIRMMHVISHKTPSLVLSTDIPAHETIPLVKVTQTSAIPRVSSEQKLIALTFDDGPYGETTNTVLDILKQNNIHATFFLMGSHVLHFPEITRRIVAEGNIIGNHSFTHSKILATEPLADLQKDLHDGETAIASTTGLFPKFFRPPYGNTSDAMIRDVQNEGYTIFLWNIDPRDWDNNNSSSTIAHTIIINAKPNAIILMHDGHETNYTYSRENTLAALPYVIKILKKQGYTFVTLDVLTKKTPYYNK